MLTTGEATELLKTVWPPASTRIWHSGAYRSWRLPEPVRMPNGRLAVPKIELERWLVERQLAEYTEL